VTACADISERNNFWRWNNPIFWGVVLSAVFIGIYGYLALQETCSSGECKTNLEVFLSSRPNEMGDTLAGLAGGLAFLWIIVTVLLQSNELAEQRRELALTREEIKLTRKAQEKQLGVLQTQAEIFLDEQRQRDEFRAEQRLDQLIMAVDIGIDRASKSDLWVRKRALAGQRVWIDHNPFDIPKGEPKLRVAEAVEALEEVIALVELGELNLIDKIKESDLKHTRFISNATDEILQLENELSEAQKQRVKNLDIRKLVDLLISYENCGFILLKQRNGSAQVPK